MSEHRDKSIFDLMDEMMDLSDSISGRRLNVFKSLRLTNQNHLEVANG